MPLIEADLMDPNPLPPGDFTHSIMGLYHYYEHAAPTESCLVHRDMGLITLIPRANVPGLQVLDYHAHGWNDVETTLGENDIVVIGCQTLERLTGSYYPACVHRVVSTPARRSIVFKLRGPSLDTECSTHRIARSSAELDMKGLQSPVLQKLFTYWPPAIRVDDWVTKELHYNESVNFPGASLANYKSCILDPNLNAEGLEKFAAS